MPVTTKALKSDPLTLEDFHRGKDNFLKTYGKFLPTLPPQGFAFPGYSEGAPEARRNCQRYLLADRFHLRKAASIAEKQAQYLKEKAELKAALVQAETKPESAAPRLQSFARILAMIGEADGTYTKLGFVNSGISNILRYDRVKYTDTHARTLLAAITTGFGICDDIARLKLFVLEELIERKKLDLKISDLRWIGEEFCLNGNPVRGHAVVAVRVKGDQTFVLDSQMDYKVTELGEYKKTIDWVEAEDSIRYSSHL